MTPSTLRFKEFSGTHTSVRLVGSGMYVCDEHHVFSKKNTPLRVPVIRTPVIDAPQEGVIHPKSVTALVSFPPETIHQIHRPVFFR